MRRPGTMVGLVGLAVGILSWIRCGGEPEFLPGPPDPADPPHVVVICLDTLRPDRLGAYGHEGGLTPHLDRFAESAAVFHRAYSQANETVFSHASLFTGRYPSELGPLSYHFELPDDVPTLASVLGHYGYRTGAVVSGGHVRAEFGLDRGFHHWEVAREWGSLYHAVPRALDWLDAGEPGQPSFLFLHGYDTHNRYLKPAPFGFLFTAGPAGADAARLAIEPMGTASIIALHHLSPSAMRDLVDFRAPRLIHDDLVQAIEKRAGRPGEGVQPLDPEDVAFLRGVYDGAVHYADAWFGRLWRALRERRLHERAWIAVVSDHGEGLGEHGVFNHRYHLADEETRVVLMLRPPGGLATRRDVADPVGLLDVMPTLLQAADARLPAGIHGRSLLPVLRGRAAPSREAVFQEGTFRMVSARSRQGRLTFEGLGADSPFLLPVLESTPLSAPAWSWREGTRPETRHVLRRALVRWRRSLSATPAGGEAPDPALLEMLRERGYWEAP